MHLKSFTLVTIIALLAASLVYAENGKGRYVDPTTKMEFAFIKGGTFDMGDVSKKDLTASPAHKVTVQDFYMGIYEVTFNQYDLYCEMIKKPKPDDAGWGRGKRPVINVTWTEANNFTKWLSKKSKRKFRQPTEAEWEYAARAGTVTKYWWGNKSGNNNANCKDCGSQWDGKMTAPVGSFAPNPWGLYDMLGNVAEWLLDNRHEDYVSAPTDGSTWTGKEFPTFRMDRGGNWHNYAVDLKVYDRSYHKIGNPKKLLGIRLVMEL